MQEYEFELIYRLDDNEDPQAYLDTLFENGCSDASPSVGQPGWLGLSFCREADNATIAVKSAIQDVSKAIPHAELCRAHPWLMNISELAWEFGFTKQNMQKYLRGATSLGQGPAPVIAGKTSYWNVALAYAWLSAGGSLAYDPERYSLYANLWALNIEIERTNNPDTDVFNGFLKTA